MARAPQYINYSYHIESFNLDFYDFEVFDKFRFHPINPTKASFDLHNISSRMYQSYLHKSQINVGVELNSIYLCGRVFLHEMLS